MDLLVKIRICKKRLALMVVMQTETTRRDVLVLNPETVFCVKGTVTKSLSHLTVAIKKSLCQYRSMQHNCYQRKIRLRANVLVCHAYTYSPRPPTDTTGTARDGNSEVRNQVTSRLHHRRIRRTSAPSRCVQWLACGEFCSAGSIFCQERKRRNERKPAAPSAQQQNCCTDTTRAVASMRRIQISGFNPFPGEKTEEQAKEERNERTNQPARPEMKQEIASSSHSTQSVNSTTTNLNELIQTLQPRQTSIKRNTIIMSENLR